MWACRCRPRPGAGPRRIRGGAVAPGAIRTPVGRDAGSTPEAEADLPRLIPNHRAGAPDDIADAVVAMASDLPAHVVGTTLQVDGGTTLFPGFATGGVGLPVRDVASAPAGIDAIGRRPRAWSVS